MVAPGRHGPHVPHGGFLGGGAVQPVLAHRPPGHPLEVLVKRLQRARLVGAVPAECDVSSPAFSSARSPWTRAARSVGRMACTARFSASSASTLGMPRSSSRATSSLVVAAERPRCSACSPMVSGPLPGRRGARCPRCAPSDLGPNHALVTGCPSWTLPVRTPVNPRVTGITHRARRTVLGTRVWRRRGGDVRGGARDLSWI